MNYIKYFYQSIYFLPWHSKEFELRPENDHSRMALAVKGGNTQINEDEQQNTTRLMTKFGCTSGNFSSKC